MLLLLATLGIIGSSSANLLIPGITSEEVRLDSSVFQMLGFPQTSLNGTDVEIRVQCQNDVDFDFEMQFVLRSSPCDKEFFDARNGNRLRSLLQTYFNDSLHIPDPYEYKHIVYYKSPSVKFSCRNSHDITFPPPTGPMLPKNVTTMRGKRSTGVVVKRDADPRMLSTFHSAQTIPVDGIYFLILQITGKKFPENSNSQNITVTVKWRGPYGYLSAVDYPLLRFYILMCVFYAILALVWLALCIKYYKDILRIQYWIGALIILGMVEKAFFLSEYSTMNDSGKSVDGIIELAEIVSCAKRTMSRVLVIIVSVGYGVVKPRLGNTLSQVAGVGFVYFLFCAIEGLARVSKNHVEAAKQRQFAALPLVITEMVIFYWIFISLAATMRTLRLKRNEVKLSVYRHFMNTLVFAVLASVIFMLWSLFYHVIPTCLLDWKELWVDTAFWHVLFCFVFIVIMILFRPSNNNQQYAFTPLLDDSEDENEDEIFNAGAPGYHLLTQRDLGAGAKERKEREKDREDHRLQEDLKWIENHIPTSLTDALIMDDEEDREARELELNKMM